MYHNNHKKVGSIDFVKNFIGLGCEYLPFDSLSIIYHFFVVNFEFSLSEPFNNFIIFHVVIIYMIVAEMCENLKVVSSNISTMKNIVPPCLLKSLPIKLICCGSFNLSCLLKSIAIIIIIFFWNNQNPINCQLYDHYCYSYP